MNAAYKYDILENHNDYDISISRKELEAVRNDPFDLKGKFKGMSKMSFQQSLAEYAEELVSNYATYHDDRFNLSLSNLPESEQNELVRLYLEENDRDLSECIYGNDFSIENDYTCALLKMLQNDSQENRDNFAGITRKNIITYYMKTLQDTLDDACHLYQCNMQEEAGFYAQQCRESGDVYWSRY